MSMKIAAVLKKLLFIFAGFLSDFAAADDGGGNYSKCKTAKEK